MGRQSLILDYRCACWLLLGALAASTACGPGAEDDTSGSGGAAPSGGSASGGTDSKVGGAPSDGGSATGGVASGGTSSGGASSGGASSGGASSGGASSGGTSSGGASSGGVSAGGNGAGGGDTCVQIAEPHIPRRARSQGFSGSDADYSKLYEDPCAVPSDCVAPCVERGGTTEFCGASICIDSDTDYCLPPTKWRGLDGALSESGSVDDSAVTSLSLANGDDHDRLILDDFGFEVPEEATIVGILATIHRASGEPNEASDHVIRIVKDGAIGETAREKDGYWPVEVTAEDYGGPTDLWGDTWTAADINAQSFGLAIAALPTENTGRAYVDVALLRIHYRVPSCQE